MDRKPDYGQCVAHCRFDHLPEGLEAAYRQYVPGQGPLGGGEPLIPRQFLESLAAQYEPPESTLQALRDGAREIEEDELLLGFTRFLVDRMCEARLRCDGISYTNMTPGCMKRHGSLYSFLLLLACVTPSMRMLERRGVPKSAYEQIPHRPMRAQLERLAREGDATVRDFPWDMNFYTCSIFLLDRFFFIPHRFEDPFTMYRNRQTGEAVALRHAGERFRRDGQLNDVNGVGDPAGAFTTSWQEDGERLMAHRINPTGYVEREPVTLFKRDWEPALQPGDILLALHIPSGPGYTPERLKASMTMAADFYRKHYPELPIRGFWSESWLYDPRLSLVLDPGRSNIVQVQRQLYNYPIAAGDGMLRYEVFGDWKADPVGRPGEFTTSLQKAAAGYMKKGGRFHTTSMIVLLDEVDRIGNGYEHGCGPYITAADVAEFRRTVDSHLERGAAG